MKSLTTVLVLIAGFAIAQPGVSRAAPPTSTPSYSEEARATAKRAYQRGTAQYKQDHYDEAIAEFEAGYKAVPQPVFLFNIAQAYRLSERVDKALEYYKRYLEEAPTAPNRKEVEDRIAALDKIIADKKKAEQELLAAQQHPEPEPAPPPLLAAPIAPVAPVKKVKKPVWPIVVGVIGGVVVVGAAVGLGVYFGTQSTPPLWQPVSPTMP